MSVITNHSLGCVSINNIDTNNGNQSSNKADLSFPNCFLLLLQYKDNLQ